MPTQFTLRKAARVRSQIEARLAEIKMDFSVAQVPINLFDPNPLEQITAHAEKFETAYARYKTLASVLYELRARIGSANEEAGIPRLLSAISLKNLLLKQIQVAVAAAPKVDDTQIVARLAGEKELATSGRSVRYGNGTDVAFDVLSQTQVDGFKTEGKSIRKEIVNLTDRLEALNNTALVQVSDEIASVLTAENVL